MNPKKPYTLILREIGPNHLNVFKSYHEYCDKPLTDSYKIFKEKKGRLVIHETKTYEEALEIKNLFESKGAIVDILDRDINAEELLLIREEEIADLLLEIKSLTDQLPSF